jgi:hypothetical protein
MSFGHQYLDGSKATRDIAPKSLWTRPFEEHLNGLGRKER